MIALLRRLFRRTQTPAADVPAPSARRDPFADHPVQCKCYFHR